MRSPDRGTRRHPCPFTPPLRLVGRTIAVVILLAATTAALGCASMGTSKTAYSPTELRAEVLPRVPSEQRAELAVPFQVTPELTARAKALTSGANSEHERATQLLRAITGRDGFALHWEPVGTSVAEDTVERGHGNCMSLTSLYVGLARSLGLSAYYIDASDRVRDIRREQELIVDSGHVAATVRTERGWSLVDFDGEISDFRTFRIIDDVEALAHYYNNRGYEIIHTAQSDGREIPWDDVRGSFALAVAVRPDFARAHNNLGVVYARAGQDGHAVAAYEAAIRSDPDFAAPYHNLANLLARAGRQAEAVETYGQAVRRQPKNPYIYYHLGLALQRQGDTQGAIEAFERSISLKGDYPEPRNVLAQLYRQLGRIEEAARIQGLSGRVPGAFEQEDPTRGALDTDGASSHRLRRDPSAVP